MVQDKRNGSDRLNNRPWGRFLECCVNVPQAPWEKGNTSGTQPNVPQVYCFRTLKFTTFSPCQVNFVSIAAANNVCRYPQTTWSNSPTQTNKGMYDVSHTMWFGIESLWLIGHNIVVTPIDLSSQDNLKCMHPAKGKKWYTGGWWTYDACTKLFGLGPPYCLFIKQALYCCSKGGCRL